MSAPATSGCDRTMHTSVASSGGISPGDSPTFSRRRPLAANPLSRRRDAAAVLIKEVLFPAWALKNRSPRLRYAEEFERTQFLGRDALLELQWRQFKAVLRHAYDHCAYYRKKMSAAGITPDDVR